MEKITFKINYKQVLTQMSKRKYILNKAFTLAEVLITLAVIGIVAALTIGIFLPKIHSQIRAHQIAVAETKFTKAMEQMALNNAIGPYYETTKDFVDELQNYLKIAKVCDNDKLQDCFGYEKLLLSNGEEFELSEIKTGENLGKDENYLETVGLVTIDGTGMILSWNKKCDILEPKVYAWGNNTNETTSCVAILMDINLDKSPNRINKDIVLFRAESIDSTCGIKFANNCWGTPFLPAPLTDEDCAANNTAYGITNCINSYYSNKDYWGGAMKQCKSEGKRLSNGQELMALAQYLYGTDNINFGTTTNNLVMDTNALGNLSLDLLSAYQTNNNILWLWSSDYYDWSEDYLAPYREFRSTSTGYGGTNRTASTIYAVCVP